MAIIQAKHGRIRVLSGDTVPLVYNVTFSNADFSYDESFPAEVQRDRSKIVSLVAGDEEPVTWSFSARVQSKLLTRVLRDKVWPAEAETFAGLTPSANNLLTPAYAFEQGSVVGGTGETIVKLAPGATPSADNELAEAVGAADLEGVTEVAIASGALQVYQPAGDVSRDLVYDAVGQTTLATPAGQTCASSKKCFKLELQIYDVCDPPDPTDPTVGTVDYTIELDDSYLTGDSFAEADEADTISFSGSSLIDRVVFA